MSNFRAMTLHPGTGHYHLADWLDDYFGANQYGIRFVGGEHFYKAYEVERAENMQFFNGVFWHDCELVSSFEYKGKTGYVVEWNSQCLVAWSIRKGEIK
jgi:hypothetical protein